MSNLLSSRGLRLGIYLLAFGVFVTAGCQEAERGADAGSGDMIRRAQLTGQENIQLKRTLAEKDREIDELKRSLAAEQARYANFTEQQSELTRDLMQKILECQTKLNAYEQ